MITKINSFIEELIQKADNPKVENVGEALGLSKSMISNYRTGKHLPSIELAVRVYTKYKVVLHPFSKESLELFKNEL